jgi:hypothetical protein
MKGLPSNQSLRPFVRASNLMRLVMILIEISNKWIFNQEFLINKYKFAFKIIFRINVLRTFFCVESEC